MKGIQPVKTCTSKSKLLEMEIDVTGWDTARCTMWIQLVFSCSVSQRVNGG